MTIHYTSIHITQSDNRPCKEMIEFIDDCLIPIPNLYNIIILSFPAIDLFLQHFSTMS